MGDSLDVKLTLEGLTVRSEGGYVAVATKKHKLQPDGWGAESIPVGS